MRGSELMRIRRAGGEATFSIVGFKLQPCLCFIRHAEAKLGMVRYFCCQPRCIGRRGKEICRSARLNEAIGGHEIKYRNQQRGNRAFYGSMARQHGIAPTRLNIMASLES